MATIKVEVEFEGLENSELDGFAEKLYDFLASEGRRTPSPFAGVVVNVAENDRGEDEDAEEET